MVASALIQNGRWNKMSWKEQQLYVKDNATRTILRSLETSGQWNKLDLKTQEAIVRARGGQQLVDVLSKAGLWNSLSFKQQQALVTTKGTADVMNALNQMGKWNQLTPKQQQAIVNAKGTPQLQQLISNYGLWRNLPASVVKQIVAEDRASGNLKAANEAISAWQRANPGAPKNALAIDSASGPFRNATASVFNWNGTGANGKTANGFDAASSPFNNATNSVGRWNGTGASGKIAKANDQATGPINAAINAIKRWNETNPITHFLTVVERHVKGHATGTNYHPGGLMMVNDQPGPVFRELVQYPGMQPFIPFGRNVIFDAPRGTKVVKASDTARQFPHLPQYANGTNDAVSVLSSLKPNVNNSSVVNNTYEGKSDDTKMDQLLGKVAEMTNRLGTMLGLSAAQLSAIKASAFDKDQLYTTMGRDQIYLDEQRL